MWLRQGAETPVVGLSAAATQVDISAGSPADRGSPSNGMPTLRDLGMGIH